MDYLYGKLNNEVKYREYKGSETTTATVTIDDSSTVSVDVKKVPNELTLTTINGDTYTYDGSEPASFDIRTQVTDKVEEGNNLPVTSDAVKGYVDSKAGALEYVGGEGNFTNINGGVTVKGRLNVDDGIYSPVNSDDPNFVPNNKSVDDKITASEQKLIDERIGAFTRTADKLFTDVEGGMTVKGHLNVDGGITSASAPTSYKDVTNKGYVDGSRLFYIGTTSIKSAIHDDTGTHLKSSTIMRTKSGLDYQGSTEMLIPIVGKDGVIIENDSDSIVAVKADVEAIQKDMAGRFGNNSLWYTSTTGEPSGFGVTDAGDSGAIPVITDGLRLPETIPDENYVAVHKKYVEDGFVPKQIPSDTRSAYITETNGEQSILPIHGGRAEPFSIASRSAGGVLKVGTPVADEDATTKQYVDKGFVKSFTGTTSEALLYYTVGGGNDSVIPMQVEPDGNTIAQRREGGRLSVGTPTEDNDATTKKYVDDADAKKLNLTGGTITGSLAIQGDLTVTGTTTTEKAQTLAVKDSVIITNADGAELGSTLSGIAIKKDGENTYGVMYDPSGDSVKLGLGTLDAENKFTFNESGTDGKAIATRADSSALTDGDLVKWDGTTNSLVDSGKKTDDFVEKVTVTEGSNRAYIAANNGTQDTIPINTFHSQFTIAQRKIGGALEVGKAVEDSDAMPKKQVEDGFVKKGTSNSACYCIDYTGSENMVNYSIYLDKPYTLAQRDVDYTLKVGTPVGVSDATTKKYVDDGFVAKVTTTSGANLAYIAKNDGTQSTYPITYLAQHDTIAQRGAGGTLKVGKAVEDSDAMTKKQVEDGFVAKKNNPTYKAISTIDKDSSGNWQYLWQEFNHTAKEWTFPIRAEGGVLRVGTPVGVNDATTKAYVDGGFVPKVTVTKGSNLAYVAKNNGIQGTIPIEAIPIENSMVQRTAGGVVKVGTAVEYNDAMPKKQVEDNFIPKSTFTDAWQVLVTGENSDAITTRGMSVDPANHNIPNFDNQGRLLSNNPDGTAPTETSDKYAVNVGYANANYAAKLTQPYVVYLNDGEGKLFPAHYNYQPGNDDVVCYDGIGCLRTNDPNGEDGRLCVNKKYAYAHYVAKIGTGTQAGTILYGRDFNGNEKGYVVESIAHNASTIVERKSGGAVEVGTAVADSDAMPKKQVEDGFVAKTSTTEVVYATDSSGVQKEVPYTAYVVGDSIVLRDSKGHINVANPNSAYHATNKAYVDNLNAITITAGA